MTKNYEYLEKLAKKTITDCTFTKEFDFSGNLREIDLILPSGDGKYPSFWVRDSIMMIESGLVSVELVEKYIEIFATYGQNGENTIELENGLSVPPFAVCDHVNYNGKPVYFPGTYKDGSWQGEGRYGYLPPFCDNYYFILLVKFYLDMGGKTKILEKDFNGYTLATRIEKALSSYGIDKETELCMSDEEKYTVDWGFVDSVKKTGKLLFASILRYRAAKALADICEKDGKKNYYTSLAQKIAYSIKKEFYDEKTGWLYSATGLCHQLDVWGTAYAVYLEIIDEEKTYKALVEGYRAKTAVCDGQIRQILTNCNFNSETAWECSLAKLNTYQNGGFWATATGWYAGAIYSYDKETAENIISDFIAHTEKYKNDGSPYEWINKDTSDFSGRLYGTSGVLPFLAYKEKFKA